jgi:hypothetical protein
MLEWKEEVVAVVERFEFSVVLEGHLSLEIVRGGSKNLV